MCLFLSSNILKTGSNVVQCVEKIASKDCLFGSFLLGLGYMKEDKDFEKMIYDAIPFGRIAEPREVAQTVLFLVSEASSYITGQTVTIDGGVMGRGPNT